MAYRFDVVAVRIEDEGPVVGRVVLGAKPGTAVVVPARRDGRLVEGLHCRAVVGGEGDVDGVAWLARERVRSGVAAAKARGQVFGRRPGYRPSDKRAAEVMRLVGEEGYSQRRTAERLGISKTTVNEIVKRSRQQAPGSNSPES